MTETTNDPKLLKTLVCLERQQYNIPDEYSLYNKKLSTRYELVFFEKKNHYANQPANNRHKHSS